jgi:hypothetical protein
MYTGHRWFEITDVYLHGLCHENGGGHKMIGFMILESILVGIILYSCVRESSLAERMMEKLRESKLLGRENDSGGNI